MLDDCVNEWNQHDHPKHMLTCWTSDYDEDLDSGVGRSLGIQGDLAPPGGYCQGPHRSNSSEHE